MPKGTAQKILGFIESECERNGRAASIRDIQQYMGFKSPRAVTYHLEALVKSNLLWKVRNRYLPHGKDFVCRLEDVL